MKDLLLISFQVVKDLEVLCEFDYTAYSSNVKLRYFYTS